MAFLTRIAEILGTDPVSLVVLGTLSAACAVYMKRLASNSWLALIYFPVLMAGGLLADDVAVALGLYPAPAVGSSFVNEGLSNVLLAGLAGMTIAGLALMAGLRRFQ